MRQLEVGVGGNVIQSHEENGVTVIDEFQLTEASIIAPNPFSGPLTPAERELMNYELDRIYRTSSQKTEEE